MDGWARRDPRGRRHRKQSGAERRTAPRYRRAAYAIGPEFGIYVEVHAATGARSGQIALLDVGDLHAGKEPKLMMPSSLKGKNRRTRTRKPMPITPSLAKRLKQAAAGRDADRAVAADEPDGKRWNSATHRLPFAEAAKAARLPDGATIYCLRHTAITRALLAGVPVSLVASIVRHIGRDDRKNLQQIHRRSRRRADAAGAVRRRRACGWQRHPVGAVICDGQAAPQ